MNDTLTFAIAMFMNIAGAGLLLSALFVVLLQSMRSLSNRLLAAYLSLCLIWSVSSLTTRVVMTSTLVGTTNESITFALITIVLIGLCANSPFLLGFAIDYANAWHESRWRISFVVASIVNLAACITLIISPHLLLKEFGISQVGMLTVETSPVGFAVIGICYFVWYGAAIFLLATRAMTEAKPIILGSTLMAFALLIESTTSIGDLFPVAILSSGIAAICFASVIVRDQALNPLRASNEALLRNQDNLEQIMSAIPAGATVTDKDGQVLWANPQILPLLGWESGTLVGSNMTQFFAFEDEQQRLIDAMKSRGHLRDAEFRYRTVDGKVRWGRLNMTPLQYNGEPATLDVLEDIHDQRMAEESLQQSQKWESMAVLAGGVAHDFNNLLSAIMGHAAVLDGKLRHDPTLHKHVKAVTSATKRSADLTKQMLAYSGKGKFITRLVDLNEIVRENIGLIYASTSHAVHVDTHLVESLPQIMADPTQMQQIVMNLAINAAQAVEEEPEGHITFHSSVCSADDICYSEGDWHYRVGEIEDSHYVVLNVVDNGMGMDADTLDQIFNPFFTTKETGSGLGLSAVLGIMRGHHGMMRVRSLPNVGTTFQLLFPAVLEREPMLA